MVSVNSIKDHIELHVKLWYPVMDGLCMGGECILVKDFVQNRVGVKRLL
jgi:hypothetical protein